jgi:hypothetical protein
MPDDIEGKLAVAARVGELVRWGSPQGNAAEDEGTGMVRELLLPISAFLAHQANGLELFEPLLRDAESRQYGLD